MADPCIRDKEIGGLLEAKENFEKFMTEMRENHLTSIYNKLDEIKDKMSSRRPTYMVLWIITSLTTLCGVLLTILLKR